VSHRAQIVPVSLAVVAAMLSATGLLAQEHDTVWVWNTECHNPSIIAIRASPNGSPCAYERRAKLRHYVPPTVPHVRRSLSASR